MFDQHFGENDPPTCIYKVSEAFEKYIFLALLIQFYGALFSSLERRHSAGRSCGGLESASVNTPGPDGNCVTVWVWPVLGGSNKVRRGCS